MPAERETIQMIFDKLFLFIIPAKILGLLPWRIRGDGLTREGLFGRICCIFLVAVSSLLTIGHITHHIEFLSHRTLEYFHDNILAETLTLIGYLLVVVTEVYREFTDARTGYQIIESLAQYDRKVKQLGLARKDNFFFAWIIGLSIISSLLPPIIRPMTLPILHIRNFIDYYGPMPLRLAYQLARLKYFLIVHLLYQRYKHLNETVLPKDKWRIRGNLAVNRRVVNMRDLVYLHSTLTRATKLLAEAYSFELFVWISSPIWELLVALINVSLRRVYGIQGFAEAAQVLLTFWSLCWICRTITNEANKFAMQILRTDPELIRSRDIDEQLDAAIYLYNHKISFRVWKFDEISFSLIISIASLTASLGMVVFDGYHGVESIW